jgi:hypothetical protein
VNGHPSNEALIAYADHGDVDVLAHLSRCAECKSRYARLLAGTALIEQARRTPPPAPDWRVLDPKIMAAAAAVAEDVRRGARSKSRRHTALYSGMAIAVAAAAVGVFALRRHPARTSLPTAVAVTKGLSRVPVAAERRDVAAAGNDERSELSRGEPVEGVVLMMAAPVAYTAPGGVRAGSLTGETRVREGGRIATGEHGGRAVLALHGSYRVDARAGSEVTFARLSTTETTMALAKGETRIEGTPAESERVAVRVPGWTVRANGGAFVTKIDGDVVHVRVVKGRVAVAGVDGSEREVNDGSEVELLKDGGRFRVMPFYGRDVDAVDMAFLSREGRAFVLPTVPGGRGVSVSGHGTLPVGTTVVRTRTALSLQTRVRGETWATTLEPSAPAQPVWHRSVRVAAAGSVALTRAEAPAGPSSVRLGPPSVSQLEAGETNPASAQRFASNRLSEWVSACFTICTREQNCGYTAAGINVRFKTDTDGSISQVRVVSGGSVTLRECIVRASARFPMPRTLRSSEFLLEIDPARSGGGAL